MVTAKILIWSCYFSFQFHVLRQWWSPAMSPRDRVVKERGGRKSCILVLDIPTWIRLNAFILSDFNPLISHLFVDRSREESTGCPHDPSPGSWDRSFHFSMGSMLLSTTDSVFRNQVTQDIHHFSRFCHKRSVPSLNGEFA